MDKNLNTFMRNMVEVMRKYNEEKKEQGFIPTIDLWIEEMEEKLNPSFTSEKDEETKDPTRNKY